MALKQYIGFIFARGGSKGIPRKNVMKLAGKPLIAHSIDLALACKRINRVIVSTDDNEVAEVALKYGAEVPFMRPKELASDTSAEILSWRHAIEKLSESGDLKDNTGFLSIPCTSPFRSVEDINNCIDAFEDNDADISITISDAHRHPSFNMVKEISKGSYELVLPLGNAITRRQDAPKIFDITTVCYVASPEYILNCGSLLEGKVTASLVPPERALDIDTELDFEFAKFLMERSKK